MAVATVANYAVVFNADTMKRRVAIVKRVEAGSLPAQPRGLRAARVGDWLLAATGVLLVAMLARAAYATLLAAATAAIQPISLDFGETTIYAATLRILQGQPLYQPVAGPPYTVTPYTPMYHVAAAGLRAVFGEGFGPGRVLSAGAGVATAIMLALVASRTARAAWVGVLAGLLFLALAFPGGTPWLGLYRVDTLGVALSVAAITVLSAGQRRHASLSRRGRPGGAGAADQADVRGRAAGRRYLAVA